MKAGGTPVPPIPSPVDPCDCNAVRALPGQGCASRRTSAFFCDVERERICYVQERCPGFRLSNFQELRAQGLRYKCVPTEDC